jgi:hypothetical protein
MCVAHHAIAAGRLPVNPSAASSCGEGGTVAVLIAQQLRVSDEKGKTAIRSLVR